MNHLSSTLVLCDLDHLLLGADGNLTQVVRDVLQLFVRRGGRFYGVFPSARRGQCGPFWAVCGSALLRWCAAVPWPTIFPMAPASRCAPLPGRMRPVRPPAGGRGRGHCPADDRRYHPRAAHERGIGASSAAGMDPLSAGNAADIKGEEVLRVLLYQDSKAVPMISLLEKSLGDRTAVLLGERAAADTLILTPRTVSGREMLDAVCMPVGTDPEDVLVLAGGLPMLDMVRASSQSTAAADAPAELRLAAQKVTLTDAAAGSAVEVLYRMVRDAENLA